MSLLVNDDHRKAFQEIFNLIATVPDDKSTAKIKKMDKDGLVELFKLIDYKTTEE